MSEGRMLVLSAFAPTATKTLQARFSSYFSSLRQKRIPSIDSSLAAAARDKAEGAEAQKHKR
jgi:hypothetical protein